MRKCPWLIFARKLKDHKDSKTTINFTTTYWLTEEYMPLVWKGRKLWYRRECAQSCLKGCWRENLLLDFKMFCFQQSEILSRQQLYQKIPTKIPRLYLLSLPHPLPFYPSGKKYQVKGSIKLVKTRECSNMSASSISCCHGRKCSIRFHMGNKHFLYLTLISNLSYFFLLIPQPKKEGVVKQGRDIRLLEDASDLILLIICIGPNQWRRWPLLSRRTGLQCSKALTRPFILILLSQLKEEMKENVLGERNICFPSWLCICPNLSRLSKCHSVLRFIILYQWLLLIRKVDVGSTPMVKETAFTGTISIQLYRRLSLICHLYPRKARCNQNSQAHWGTRPSVASTCWDAAVTHFHFWKNASLGAKTHLWLLFFFHLYIKQNYHLTARGQMIHVCEVLRIAMTHLAPTKHRKIN